MDTCFHRYDEKRLISASSSAYASLSRPTGHGGIDAAHRGFHLPLRFAHPSRLGGGDLVVVAQQVQDAVDEQTLEFVRHATFALSRLTAQRIDGDDDVPK